MAPKYGLDDGSSSNFDATLVLATMLISQLHVANSLEPHQAATTIPGQNGHSNGSQGQRERRTVNVSGHPSDHTRVWSELSGKYSASFFNCDSYESNILHTSNVCRKCSKKW